MPPSIMRWTFYSPLRLAVVSLAVAGILVGGVLIATSQPQHNHAAIAQPAARQTHAPTATVPPTPTPTPSETLDARAHANVTKASRIFVNAWATNEQEAGRNRWLRTIRPLTTDSLFRGLKVTDLARLPRGSVERVRLQEAGAFAATSTVTLSSGLQVEVHLVAEKGHWVVADLRPVGP